MQTKFSPDSAINKSKPESEPPPYAGWTREVAGLLGTGALATLFFLFLLWRDPMLCWNDDYAISILPVLRDVARSWSEGHWPLLSPYCWACGNLAGEYQYGTFSVFVNMVVVLAFKCQMSYPDTAAAISAAHLFVMAAGGYQLARGRGLNASLATMVGLIAALNGWMVCWGATDWFGALAALAWLPWAWWALEESLRTTVLWRRWLLPAPFVYLLVAGGFPYTVIMLVVVTVFLAVRCWLTERRLFAVAPLAVGWILGLGLSAPAWLSLLEYMQGSARSHGDDLHHEAWVVPWQALPGLVSSSWGARWLDFAGGPWVRPGLEFTGSLVPFAALAAVFAKRLTGRWRLPACLRWDAGFALFILVLCMLPSAGVFRWSFRWLPLFHLALALAGGEALRWWRESKNRPAEPVPRRWEHPAVWAVGLTALVAVLGQISGLHSEKIVPHPERVSWVLFGVALVWWGGVVWLPVSSGFRRWLPVAVTLWTMTVAYTLMPTNPQMPRYPFTDNLAGPAPLSQDRLYLSFTDAPFLVYHGEKVKPGFGAMLRLGSTAMFGAVHLVNGYSPIRAAGAAQTFKLETHGQIDFDHLGEFLTPEMTAHDGLLARLGIDGILIADDVPYDDGPGPPEEWEKVVQTDEGVVYHRRGGAMPEVSSWQSREPGEKPDLSIASVKVIENSRHRVKALVSGGADPTLPVLLAFRRPYFPGYHATLNGKELAVGSYRSLLPTVELPAGGAGGEVDLFYRPRAVVIGGIAAAASLLAMLVIGYAVRRIP